MDTMALDARTHSNVTSIAAAACSLLVVVHLRVACPCPSGVPCLTKHLSVHCPVYYQARTLSLHHAQARCWVSVRGQQVFMTMFQ